MTRILAILLLPAGIALIAGAGAIAAGRAARSPAGPSRPGHAHHLASASGRYHPALDGPARLLLLLLGGAAIIYGVMVGLGILVIHAGPVIDKPIFHWTVTHRVHSWYDLMGRATEVGDKYPTWAAAATAAVCLAVAWRRDKWLPPVILGALIVVDHFLTIAINHTDHRTPPPGAGGIFPSGGSERAILFYGLIAYLLWREFSGTRQGAIWAGTVAAALGFHEGYTRAYLAVHWFTDVLSGWFYGCLMLALFIAAVRLTLGPARAPAPAVTGRHATMPVRGATG